jgi:uncharacterized protein with beta-barrel porin domain
LVAWEGEASTRPTQIHHHLRRGRAIVLGDSYLRHEHVRVSASGAFQTLPGASFVVNGATQAKNSALTSAGAELRLANGVSLLAKFDGEFAAHSSTYAGTGTIRHTW